MGCRSRVGCIGNFTKFREEGKKKRPIYRSRRGKGARKGKDLVKNGEKEKSRPPSPEGGKGKKGGGTACISSTPTERRRRK